MEYIDIINIVNDAWLSTTKFVEHEMKKNLRIIELSDNKENAIKDIIKSLNYEKSWAGYAYINSNYTLIGTFWDIRKILSDFYFNNKHITKYVKEEKIPEAIKDDVEDFFLLFRQEIKLRNMLQSQSKENHSKYSDTLLNIFLNDISVADVFFSRIRGKKGVKVVNEILALRNLRKMRQRNKITNKLLFEELSKVCCIGCLSTFNSAFNLGITDKTITKRKNEIEEAEKAYNK